MCKLSLLTRFIDISTGEKGFASFERDCKASGISTGPHYSPSSSHHFEVHESFSSGTSSNSCSSSEDVRTGSGCATQHIRAQVSRGKGLGI